MGAEFGVVFLAEGPRTASTQEGLDCLGLYHSGLGERDRSLESNSNVLITTGKIFFKIEYCRSQVL